MNTPIITLKTEEDDFQTDFEIIPVVNATESLTKEQLEIIEGLKDVDEDIRKSQVLIDELDTDIEKLTNCADGIDNMIAIGSGILTGLIDSFFVGEFDFGLAKIHSNEQINHFIQNYAKKKGYDGRSLEGAIKFLENRYPVDQDNIWKGKGFSSSRLHHLEDIAHHPTLLGLVAAIIVQFFRIGLFVDKKGKWHIERIEAKPEMLLKIWLPIIITGILNWLVYLAESKYVDKMGKEIPKPVHIFVKMLANAPAVISILKVANNWLGHLVSDMGGSKNTSGGGMGIPGLFISLLKEISSLPLLKNTNLPQIVSDLYSKDKFDMRNELAVIELLGKQAIPVLINECFVRCFYFVRQLIKEKELHSEWKYVHWKNVIPWGNRTINRMLTISSGTFVVIDMADAAIRSALKSGGEPATFFANMILRVNFVGLGRFAVAIGSDCYMGYRCEKLRDERIRLQSQMLHLHTAKIYYKQADMWMAAKDTEKAIYEMENAAVVVIYYYIDSINEIGERLRKIVRYKTNIEKYNPGLLENISKKIRL